MSGVVEANDAFPWGGLATGRCGGHTSKQAGKALRSQGHPRRRKRSRILATLKQKKSIYKDTPGYVQRWDKPWTEVRAPQDNRHTVPNSIPALGPTSSAACRYGGSKKTHGPAQTGPIIPAKGEVSRPATATFPVTNELQGQPTIIPDAPLMAGPKSSVSRRYGPAIIPW